MRPSAHGASSLQRPTKNPPLPGTGCNPRYHPSSPTCPSIPGLPVIPAKAGIQPEGGGPQWSAITLPPSVTGGEPGQVYYLAMRGFG